MPEGFDIDPDPTVQVSKMEELFTSSFYTMEEEDGYKVKFTMLDMLEILFGQRLPGNYQIFFLYMIS